ncbi:N-6 DNA methylase [Chlorobaculum sp. MV4-Y]|uniref:type ISP restriction/modification enzyme n=1 Tax=Chlorobaculum sp. MV4-Y TaxID=2976335 RepID=UPI0021AE9EE9|nr:type ISP restriction/modification enzyme [Chlorobaculum sp. MV4-Y]UWX58492.1 N-6 DNA methylase [Chlorobaculum sp. MV4-Y]
MMIQEYVEAINRQFKTGISTEHSYRPLLQGLLAELLPGVEVTNEPQRIECGAPDFILTRTGVPAGYIEAKDIGKPLDGRQFREQFERYRTSLRNLIITDYLEFRLFRDGEHAATLVLAEIRDGRIVARSENIDGFAELIREFGRYEGQTIRSASKLSKMMAAKARLLASIIDIALDSDARETSDRVAEANTTLRDQLSAFRQVLIHDITPRQFADIYAQTIAYGMFAARLHDPTIENFNRREAAELIPKSNPFLRKLFQGIAGYDLDDRIAWVVDSLADLFKATDVKALLRDFGKATQQHDPVIHFYETFLAEYDPALRKSRGVWYTPEPAVNFIVRAVDEILKMEFGLRNGLADTSKTTVEIPKPTHDKRFKDGYVKEKVEVHKVQILDPAAGTGTFLAEIVKHIHKGFEGQEGIWSDYVENHLIPRLNGFEILMASYAMAHLKLDMLLSETGYKPLRDQRLRVYLTNSLEEHHPETGTLFASWLSQEASEANYIKRDTPVMVVLGNPPYSGHSANKGEWIEGLLNDYKQEPGDGRLKEKNPKWLNDDYVKFIRYGQHFVEKNGDGVLAFINNHSFLDNPTFRGMRWQLLKAFDKIYVIDLHGNAKKKEACPDGSPDKNVFDIQQGVSINLFVKTGKKKKDEQAEVLHYDLFGQREVKYDFLWKNSIASLPFAKLDLDAPQYFFVRKDFEAQKVYNKGFPVNELFPVNSVGIVTARDEFVMDNDRDQLVARICNFFLLDKKDLFEKYRLKDGSSWKIDNTKKLAKSFFEEFVNSIEYRPFDKKFIYYDPQFIERSRLEVMRNLLRVKNFALVIPRQAIINNWSHVQITDCLVDNRIHYSNKGIPVVCPLYLYPQEDRQISIDGTSHRTPNLNLTIVDQIANGLGLNFTPEKEDTPGTFAPIDLLDYIYAVLHSPSYRQQFQEFLKIDFPRIPYPADQQKFWKLVELGGQLRQLHLLESPLLDRPGTTYPIAGNNLVDKVHYQDGKAFINATQYFDGVPQSAWEFYIGGYQPAQKWLKDRKGRTLNYDDVKHYQRIIVALTETERIMGEIDAV